jgi:hypothetical protein
MDRSLMTLLLRPGEFFSDLNTETQGLEIPALFVLTSGLISAVSAYLMASLTGKMMSGLLPGMELIAGIIAVISAILGTFIFWIVIAGVFFLLSSLFKGTGVFRRCLGVVGYGFLPQVFNALIIAVLSIMYAPGISVPQLSTSALQDPQAIQAATMAFMQDPVMMMIQQVTAIVSIVFILWSGYIWVYGVKEARGLSLRDAALCVGVPIVLYVIYLVYSITLARG